MANLKPLAVVAISLGLTQIVLARTQDWHVPSSKTYKALGIFAARVVDDEVNTVMDAFACRNGIIHLVQSGTGGEPPEGPTQIFVGGRTLTVNFQQDRAIVQGTGLPSSTAPLSTDAIGALKAAQSFRYGLRSSPIPLGGAKKLWAQLENKCRKK